MIVDTSALVAIIRKEPEILHFTKLILSTDRPSMSAAGYLETGIVIDAQRDAVSSKRVDETIEMLDLTIISITEAQAKIARTAYTKYGKGSGHKAQLNFGDCFAYALAIETDRPLLFKGDDFSKTDVKIAST